MSGWMFHSNGLRHSSRIDSESGDQLIEGQSGPANSEMSNSRDDLLENGTLRMNVFVL